MSLLRIGGSAKSPHSTGKRAGKSSSASSSSSSPATPEATTATSHPDHARLQPQCCTAHDVCDCPQGEIVNDFFEIDTYAISSEAKSFLRMLLQTSPEKRVGEWESVRSHAFFHSFKVCRCLCYFFCS